MRVKRNEPAGSVETGVLEEIRGEGMRVAVEDPCAPGQALTIKTDGFEQTTVVAECGQRETNYLVELRFSNAFRWTPEIWTPQHLYLPEAQKSKAQRASSGA